MSTCLMAATGGLPIGCVFEFDPTGLSNAPDLSTAAKVREYFGYGTWEAYGAGRVTVGAGSGYAVGSEGGEAAHKLIPEEMPNHSHAQRKVVASGIANIVVPTESGAYSGDELGVGQTNWYTGKNLLKTSAEGGSKAHNNLQPYRTVYRWRRIA